MNDFREMREWEQGIKEGNRNENIEIAQALNVKTNYNNHTWYFTKYGKTVCFYPSKNNWRFANGKKFVRWDGNFNKFWEWMNS